MIIDYKNVRILKKSKNHFEIQLEKMWHISPVITDSGLVGDYSGAEWETEDVCKTLKQAKTKKDYYLNLLKSGIEIK